MTEAPSALETILAPRAQGFSLSRGLEQTLPEGLVSDADGRLYRIDADFHTVLACLRRLADPNRSALQKRVYLAARFFLNHPPPDMEALFAAFVSGGQAQENEGPPLMDFEQDAGVLYASFYQQYGLNLLRTPLHWVEFRELLSGLTADTPFGARVRLRTLPDGDLPQEARAELARARERIAIPQRVSRAQTALLQELDRRLAAGEDPADVLLKMQEG